MNEGRNEYKFLWHIENYSYICCFVKDGVGLYSPEFTINELEGTTWNLVLGPNDLWEREKGNVSLFLKRCTEDSGPKKFSVKFQLSILSIDGSALHSGEFSFTSKPGKLLPWRRFIERDDILLRRKTEYLPNDTLIVCCQLWKGDGDVRTVEKCSARTSIVTEKISFFHAVESFSKLQPNVKHAIKIYPYSKKGWIVSSNLYFTNGSCCEEKIIMEITTADVKYVLHKFEISLVDQSGNRVDCGRIDFGYDASKVGICKLSLSLTRESILQRKDEYLPKDKLSLLCECLFSTGLKHEIIEENLHNLPFNIIKKESSPHHIKDIHKPDEEFSEYDGVSEDIYAIYVKQSFTDVELKTKTKSFPAHKMILCARSPVFQAVLTNDTKEKITDYIPVDEMENETVEQLLLFLYTDKLKNLKWKSACNLYNAADKYQIRKLKAICSSFLKENLNIFNASDLLLLADTHKDSNLKKVVEDFILKNEDQVFGSKEWEKLIETNPLLVIKTMHLKYKRRKEEH